MASLYGFKMKNVKRLTGREGYGYSGTMYIDNEKIGTFIDYADGAGEEVSYVSEEARVKLIKFIIKYAKINPNKFMIDLYTERPEQYERECARFKKINPFIPDEDITIETMAGNSIVNVTGDFFLLYEQEKLFKKKGYRALGIIGTKGVLFPSAWSDKEIKDYADNNKVEKLYTSLSDFDIA